MERKQKKTRAAERSRRLDRASGADADAWEHFTAPDGRPYYYNKVRGFVLSRYSVMSATIL